MNMNARPQFSPVERAALYKLYVKYKEVRYSFSVVCLLLKKDLLNICLDENKYDNLGNAKTNVCEYN